MTQIAEHDLKLIKELHRLWLAKEISGNSSELLDHCTDNIRWIPPDSSPIAGKTEIAKYLQSINVDVQTIDTSELKIHGSQSMAYLTCNYRTEYLAEGHSEAHEATGTHLWILEKSQDGVWLVALVAWSSWG